MTAYHLKYKNLNPETVKAVRDMINLGYFKASIFGKKTYLETLNNYLSNIYDIKEPKLIFLDNDNKGFGLYNQIENAIYLNNRCSLVTFLHEFKHCIQVQKSKDNTEEIARAWSLSVFYQASPKHFNNAVKKGLILFVSRNDLTEDQ